jgi:hypothetical protein
MTNHTVHTVHTAYDNPLAQEVLKSRIAKSKSDFLDLAQVCLDQGGLPLAVQNRIAAMIAAYREVA